MARGEDSVVTPSGVVGGGVAAGMEGVISCS